METFICLACGKEKPASEMQIRVDWQALAVVEGEEQKGEQWTDEAIYFCDPDCLDTAATNGAAMGEMPGTHDGVEIGYTCLHVLQRLNHLVQRVTDRETSDRGIYPVRRITIDLPRPAKIPERRPSSCDCEDCTPVAIH